MCDGSFFFPFFVNINISGHILIIYDRFTLARCFSRSFTQNLKCREHFPSKYTQNVSHNNVKMLYVSANISTLTMLTALLDTDVIDEFYFFFFFSILIQLYRCHPIIHIKNWNESWKCEVYHTNGRKSWIDIEDEKNFDSVKFFSGHEKDLRH